MYIFSPFEDHHPMFFLNMSIHKFVGNHPPSPCEKKNNATATTLMFHVSIEKKQNHLETLRNLPDLFLRLHEVARSERCQASAPLRVKVFRL